MNVEEYFLDACMHTIHLATMLNNGIGKIITVDKHFGEIINEVERVDPKEMT